MSLLSEIDWPLLRQQKLTVFKAADLAEEEGFPEAALDLCGIVNLIDAIQDEAVASGVATEVEVFGPDES